MLLRLIASLLLISSVLAADHTYADDRSRGVMVSTDITLEDIEVLGTWGVNIVRYPLMWLGHGADSATMDEYNTWLAEKLNYLDTILPVFESKGIKVVIDLHTPPGGFYSESGSPQFRLFSELWAQQGFLSVWDTIATRYKDSSAIWGFDVLNEPAQNYVAAGLKDWNQLAAEVAARIRVIDPTHRIIIEPRYGDPGRLSGLIPVNQPGIVYSVHIYYPLAFQHQGLYGRKKKIAYPAGTLTKQSLQTQLQKVVKFQKKVKKEIYIGEFSAIRWAPGKSAYNYLRDIVSLFEKNKWHWTYHAFREANPWSLEHSNKKDDNNPAVKQTDRLTLMRKTFAKNSR